jgi:hypothetical protein
MMANKSLVLRPFVTTMSVNIGETMAVAIGQSRVFKFDYCGMTSVYII